MSVYIDATLRIGQTKSDVLLLCLAVLPNGHPAGNHSVKANSVNAWRIVTGHESSDFHGPSRFFRQDIQFNYIAPVKRYNIWSATVYLYKYLNFSTDTKENFWMSGCCYLMWWVIYLLENVLKVTLGRYWKYYVLMTLQLLKYWFDSISYSYQIEMFSFPSHSLWDLRYKLLSRPKILLM